jgi:hypothetical protein
MPLSNYPNGFNAGILMREVPIMSAHAGKVFWVDSNATRSGRGTFNQPDLTLDAAIGRCLDNRGDIIYIKPNHSETITGAGGLTFDKEGIYVVGLGGYDNAPTFLMDGATTVTCLVTDDNTYIENLIFKAGHADIAIWGKITAKGCTIKHCRFIENVATENWVDCIHAGTADNDYDGLHIIGNEFIMNDAACVTAIDLLKNSADVKIIGNRITGDFDATPFAPIYSAVGEVHKNILVQGNMIHNAHDGDAAVGISIANTSSTGWIIGNHVGHQDTAGDTAFLAGAAGLYCGENYASGVLGTASGFLYPSADS